MRLWLVTCPDDFAGEYDDIEEMFKRGLTRLILDKRSRVRPATLEGFGNHPRASTDEYERWLMSLPMEFRDRVWVRGNPDAAEQLDVRGCVCEARVFMGDVPELWKRVNCVAICKSLDEVAALPEWVSGALLGPVFQPLSAMEPVKTLVGTEFAADNNAEFAADNNAEFAVDNGAESAQPQAEQNQAEQKTATSSSRRLPNIIAWGGIEPDTLAELKKMPFADAVNGVACLGGIWNYADPINAYIKLTRALDPRF